MELKKCVINVSQLCGMVKGVASVGIPTTIAPKVKHPASSGSQYRITYRSKQHTSMNPKAQDVHAQQARGGKSTDATWKKLHNNITSLIIKLLEYFFKS